LLKIKIHLPDDTEINQPDVTMRQLSRYDDNARTQPKLHNKNKKGGR
jgi:hypothetical protein